MWFWRGEREREREGRNSMNPMRIPFGCRQLAGQRRQPLSTTHMMTHVGKACTFMLLGLRVHLLWTCGWGCAVPPPLQIPQFMCRNIFRIVSCIPGYRSPRSSRPADVVNVPRFDYHVRPSIHPPAFLSHIQQPAGLTSNDPFKPSGCSTSTYVTLRTAN